MQEHTKGPWNAGRTMNAEGEPIVTVDDAEEWTVCVVDDQNGQGAPNARLIAAAPQMLEVLRLVSQNAPWHLLDAWLVETVMGAIALATSEIVPSHTHGDGQCEPDCWDASGYLDPAGRGASLNINIRVERHYGAERRYVADERQAAAIMLLTGRRTVSESDIRALSFLGHSFSEVEVGRKIAPKEG